MPVDNGKVIGCFVQYGLYHNRKKRSKTRFQVIYKAKIEDVGAAVTKLIDDLGKPAEGK